MKVIFLGTNGWYSTPTGDTTSVLIDSKEGYIILDAGNGIYKLDKYIKDDKKPVYLFISHFHIDHTSGLQILSKFNFKQGLDVYMGSGRTKDFDIFVNPPFTLPYKPTSDGSPYIKTEIRLHEISEKVENIPFKTRAIEQVHLYRDHGFRFELEGKVISYSGDAGPSDQAKKLAKDADLFICECAEKSPNETPGHFNATQAASLAKEENVKQMILMHFRADLFENLNDRKEAENEAKKIFPNTIAATDGFEIEL